MTDYPNPLDRSFLMDVIQSRPDERAIRRNYIGQTLLPKKDVYEYELNWDVMQAENGLAGVYALNGRPVPGSDKLFSQMFARVQNIMASRILDPYAIMTIRDIGTVGVTSRAEKSARTRAMREVRDKIEWCDDRIDSTLEYFVMQAMQGQIVWPPVDSAGATITELAPEWGEASFTLVFPFRAAFKQSASTLSGYNSRAGGGAAWDDPASDPMLDLEVISELIWKTTGLSARGSTIICSESVWSRMVTNTTVLARLAATETGIRFLNVGNLKDFLANDLGFKFMPYDAMWTYRTSADSSSGPTINSVPFLADGQVLILPPAEKFGDLAFAPVAGPDQIYVHGKLPYSYTQPTPPFHSELGIQTIAFPMLTAAGSIFVLDSWS